MPQDTLEQMRLLSNLETEPAQAAADRALRPARARRSTSRMPNMRQLKDRITHSFTHAAAAAARSRRVHLASACAPPATAAPTSSAPRRCASSRDASEGLTRRINIFADKALLAAFAAGTHTVTRGPRARRGHRHADRASRGASRARASWPWPLRRARRGRRCWASASRSVAQAPVAAPAAAAARRRAAPSAARAPPAPQRRRRSPAIAPAAATPAAARPAAAPTRRRPRPLAIRVAAASPRAASCLAQAPARATRVQLMVTDARERDYLETLSRGGRPRRRARAALPRALGHAAVAARGRALRHLRRARAQAADALAALPADAEASSAPTCARSTPCATTRAAPQAPVASSARHRFASASQRMNVGDFICVSPLKTI